ncbi:MAG: hypothetical protein LBS30_07575 [Planctomycetota bacterium]|nr:hypothetical protein [Planctomycetota bacterium]
MRLLGLDVGTTGCKAMLVDPESGRCVRAFREYGVDADASGRAEQDARGVWTLAMAAMRETLEKEAFPPVAAVSVSVQGDAVIPLNADGDPVHPAILGMDYRCRSELEECAGLFDGFDLFRRTGMRPHPINSFLKMLWFRSERKDAFARTAHLASYGDYLLGKLGCPGVIDMCNASRSMAFNIEAVDWDDGVLSAFAFPAGLLPRIVPSGTPLGRMDAGLTAELGLAAPPLIVAGGHDQPMCAIGAGCIDADIAVATTGTAEVISRYLPAPVLSRGMYDSYYPCYSSAMGKGWFTFSLNHVGGLALRWLRDAWCGEEVRLANESGRDPYDVIVDAMPPGPAPMYVLPHFTGSGTPFCDFSSRASFVGMTLETDRPTVALALLEGLTFDLKANLDRMRDLGMTTARLRNVGGGSRSGRWLQLKADILGVPVEVMRNADAGCLGAAIVAGVGAGVFAGHAEGVARLVAVERCHEPDPAMSAAYAERYRGYRKAYAALALFHGGEG